MLRNTQLRNFQFEAGLLRAISEASKRDVQIMFIRYYHNFPFSMRPVYIEPQICNLQNRLPRLKKVNMYTDRTSGNSWIRSQIPNDSSNYESVCSDIVSFNYSDY